MGWRCTRPRRSSASDRSLALLLSALPNALASSTILLACSNTSPFSAPAPSYPPVFIATLDLLPERWQLRPRESARGELPEQVSEADRCGERHDGPFADERRGLLDGLIDGFPRLLHELLRV